MAMVMMAVFEDTQHAEQALRALEAEGFPRREMDMRSGGRLMNQAPSERGGEDDGGVWGRVRHIFEDEGSAAESRQGAAATPSEAGGIADSDIVVVLNATDDSAAQAADILEESGAVDLGERLGETGQEQRDEPIYAVVIEEVAIEVEANPADASGAAAAGEQQSATQQTSAGQSTPAGQERTAGASQQSAAGQQKSAGQEQSEAGAKTGGRSGSGSQQTSAGQQPSTPQAKPGGEEKPAKR